MKPSPRIKSPVRFSFLVGLAFSLWLFLPGVRAENNLDRRILVDVLINGQKAHLAFDTGADASVLFQKSADRLGVNIKKKTSTNAPSILIPGQVRTRISEPFSLQLGEGTNLASFYILESVIPMDVDGILSWNDLKFKVLQIDGADGTVTFLETLPKDARHWPHWKLVEKSWKELGSKWLGFQIPTTLGRQRSAIYIDTGADQGVMLCPQRLEAWKSANPDATVTLIARYYPGTTDGLVIHEESWGSSLNLTKGLCLSNVPVELAMVSMTKMESYEATLGLYALAQLDVIVDGVNRMIYIHPKMGRTKVTPYNYNRAGALFTPHNVTGGDLIARVLKGSPAYEAGVRDGDVLTRIGELDATKWKTDPRVLPLGRFWCQPAGTKVDIICRRGEETLYFTITLKEIFPLEAEAPGKPIQK